MFLPLERTLFQQVSPKSEKGAKKLMSILVNSTPVTETRKEAVETAEAAGKNDKESKGK